MIHAYLHWHGRAALFEVAMYILKSITRTIAMNKKSNTPAADTVSLPPASVLQKRPLFPMGTLGATPGALDLLDGTGTNAALILTRHQYGDFGSICAEDTQSNLDAIAYGLRVFSAYDIGKARLWIITEADRSVTTLLLPSEY